MTDATPRQRVVIVTCMDARIDALAVLRLRLGDAHVIRNAGGRVTTDVLRSVALSVSGFGTTSVVVMEHTDCGAGIVDHATALRADVGRLAADPGLRAIVHIDGVLYDVDTGAVGDVVCWRRSSSAHPEATSAKHAFATLRG